MTAIVLVPTLFTGDKAELARSLNPDEQKQKLDGFLAQGFKIKIMNEFEYEHIHFTHYVLEKETEDDK